MARQIGFVFRVQMRILVSFNHSPINTMAMDQTLDKLSFVNDDSNYNFIVKLGQHPSPCLLFNKKHEFTDANLDPKTGFTLVITNCQDGQSEKLFLQEESEGNWTQSVNGGSKQKIKVGNDHRPPGSGPLFHMVADGTRSGVVIVGTVDIDV